MTLYFQIDYSSPDSKRYESGTTFEQLILATKIYFWTIRLNLP